MIKNKTLGILFYIRKDKLNKAGQVPIYMRITVDGIRASLATNRYVLPERWDGKAGKEKGTKEEAKTLNRYLENLRNDVYEHHSKLLEKGKEITANSLKNEMLGVSERKHTLLSLFDYHNKNMAELVGKEYAPVTLTRYETTKNHIKEFLQYQYGRSDFNLTELNYEFITNLEHYLKAVKNCNHNSTLKYIRNFRKVINIAVANDWLDKDPFIRFKRKLEETKRTFLTEEELQSIEKKIFTIDRLEQIRDVFVFCCYTGLSYVDVANLTLGSVTKGIDGKKWLIIYRQKTDTKSVIVLLPPAQAIIRKYENHPACINTGKLFPIVSNQKTNAYLKEIADICKVKKQLTFHQARHTFSTTVALNNGLPIETLSKVLGHKSIRTTQIYGKIGEKKLSKDMAELAIRLSDNKNNSGLVMERKKITKR